VSRKRSTESFDDKRLFGVLLCYLNGIPQAND
jgi:hypothetical protein